MHGENCLPAVFGEIRDSTGRPLGEVQIYVVGAEGGALSDTMGNYVLRDVPSGTVVLEAYLVGYPRGRDSVRLRSEERARVDFVLWPPTTLYDPVIIDSVCNPDGRCHK